MQTVSLIILVSNQTPDTATGNIKVALQLRFLLVENSKDGDNWTFTVTCDTKGAPMPERISLTTTATSGSANILDFGTINYTLKDAEQTYVYTITESGNVSGVINDAISTRTVSK